METGVERTMEEAQVVRALAALAHGMRLQLYRALVVVGPRGMTPGTMSEHLDVPPATLSFHLKELMNARLVTQEREGRHLIYRASFDHMRGLVEYLTANCCQGEPCLDNRKAVSCRP
jgi:ArsR family transcriptional regulator, arsenate/arsenite/antimonite-responsive transcriptional repressor